MRLSKDLRLKYYLDNLMEKVFSKSWDDIWLTFDVAISQRVILLRNRKNYIIQIKNLKENDEYFNSIRSSVNSALIHWILKSLLS